MLNVDIKKEPLMVLINQVLINDIVSTAVYTSLQFILFANDIIKNVMFSQESFSSCVKISFDKFVAPNMPWLAQKAALLLLTFIGSSKEILPKVVCGIYNFT